MKIHIVQKGDTLWEIAQQYGVDFEQLKDMNSQLSSPDMIMPGMKIKIPGTSKAVKKDNQQLKETQKKEVEKPKAPKPPKPQLQPAKQKQEKQPEQAEKSEPQKLPKHPYKDISVKPFPVLKEDDVEKPKKVTPQMPVQPLPKKEEKPMVEFDINKYTSVEFPEMPKVPETKVEKQQKEFKMPEHKVKGAMDYPASPIQQPMPMCCYIVHPCHPPMPFSVMGSLPEGFNPEQPHHAHFLPQYPMGPVSMGNPQFPMEPMNMKFPHQLQGSMGNASQKKGCGCHGPSSLPPTHSFPYRSELPESQLWPAPDSMPAPGVYPGVPMPKEPPHPFPVPPAHPEYQQNNQEERHKKDAEKKEE
ncbi:SafA/ExsA family spore coat assembly protein [Virgibacillus sediminis]|uniref:SafA/ExsA family spore coat assembly protein n=1 Tax=Virgibacillus sediminis TaxID=202260 RepID=A0ABV7A5X0_9BACI